MQPTAIAIRHVAFEGLGILEPVLRSDGYTHRIYEAGVDDFRPIEPARADLLIALGGTIGVYEDERYPFLADELRFVERQLLAGRPTLGICFGARLMARALGARAYPGPVKEVGWAPLMLTEAGRASPLAHVDDTVVLHWHGDTFDLPAGAELLASTGVRAAGLRHGAQRARPSVPRRGRCRRHRALADRSRLRGRCGRPRSSQAQGRHRATRPAAPRNRCPCLHRLLRWP